MSRPITLSVALLLTTTLFACSVPPFPGKAPTQPAVTTSFPALTPKPPEIITASWTPTPALAKPSSPTKFVPADSTNTTLPSPSPIPPSPTPVCDRAAPGNPIDITIPDDTSMQPGQAFSKTWRLVNIGGCSWTQDYAVVWFSGETFGAMHEIKLADQIGPNHGIEITIDMVAPQKPGVYQSNWKLQNAKGTLFGIGPSGDSPFWVRIVVTEPETPSQTPTSAPAPTQVVFANGLANLFIDDRLDLDTNLTNPESGDDLIFRVTGEGAFELAPENNARLASFGASLPRLADCTAAALSSDPLNLDNLAAGTYFCYRTDRGLPGWARLVFLNTQNKTLSLEVLTWSVP